jgi:hypothetical protein
MNVHSAYRIGEWVYFVVTTAGGTKYVDSGKLVQISHSLIDGEILTVDGRSIGRDLTHIFKSYNEANASI